MKLSDKILTELEYSELPFDLRQQLSQSLSSISRAGFPHNALPTTVPTWIKREALRLKLHYSTTTVLDEINARVPIFAHISKADPTLVAYTPDRQMGEADRQVVSSLGKILSKYLPLWPEEFVRTKIEEHNAEANTTVTFHKNISEIYRQLGAAGGGLTSCMTKSFERNPAEVYDNHPDISLALVHNSTGGAIARSLVYTPSEQDKRYIRCYGSPALKKWLDRNGYRAGTFVGAVFPALKLQGNNLYAMPYLDCNNSTTTTDGGTVALLDNKFLVLNSDQRRLLARLGQPAVMTSQYGTLMTTPVDTAELTFIDCLTGKVHNSMLEKLNVIDVWHEGAKLKTLEENTAGYIRTEGNVYAKSEDTIVIGTSTYINDKTYLESIGIVYLSAEYYASETPHHKSSCVSVEGSYILASDCVQVVDENGDLRFLHNSTNLKDYVRLYGTTVVNYRDIKIYAHKKSAYEVIGKRGTKVHQRFHSIATLWNGERVFSRGVKTTRRFGTTIRYKGDRPTVEQIINSEPVLNELGDNGVLSVKSICSHWSRVSSSYVYADNVPGLADILQRLGVSICRIATIQFLPVYMQKLVIEYLHSQVYGTDERALAKLCLRVIAESEAVEPGQITKAPAMSDVSTVMQEAGLVTEEVELPF